MKKIASCLLFLLSCSGMSYAYTIEELPSQMFLTQHWISYTTSFDIETKTRKMGTLYRRVLSFPVAYDFYDNSNRLMTTAQSRFFSIGAHFDVTDDKRMPLGSVEEKIFTFFPSFVILSNDGEKLARAEMNFWGTTFTVYDMQTDQVMASMYRPFFRIKNDWTIEIKNRDLLRSKNIDPGLFMTVLAFQADREYWDQQRRDDEDNGYNSVRAHASPKAVTPELQAQAKITARAKTQSLTQVTLMDQKGLEALAAKLYSDYQNQMQGSDENQTDADKMNAFITYCLSLVDSDQTSPEDKKAILFLLQERLTGGQPVATGK